MSELGIEKSTEEMDEEKQIASLMQELSAGLPEGAANLGVRRDHGGTVFYLKPSNQKSAEFGIHYDGCVDVFFGRFGTTFEIPYESGLPKHADFEATLSWAKAIGLAVIEGRCRERAGFFGVRGTVEVNGKAYGVISFFNLRLFPKTFHYAPYCLQEADR
ncbi:MAG: hypothetical protein ACLPLR_06350 [Terriglobales bacterium]